MRLHAPSKHQPFLLFLALRCLPGLFAILVPLANLASLGTLSAIQPMLRDFTSSFWPTYNIWTQSLLYTQVIILFASLSHRLLVIPGFCILVPPMTSLVIKVVKLEILRRIERRVKEHGSYDLTNIYTHTHTYIEIHVYLYTHNVMH